ncbi:MAG: cysteine synthase family protein [Elusimicrobia bacterium]|nr:cysteine synthase family protein [Elusimicrobiota bacterium]
MLVLTPRSLDSLKVGQTPLIDVSFAFPELGDTVKILGKAEWANPGGSIKDRAGYFILKDALKTGKLSGDKVLLDSSSGNTGIAYAWMGARLGVKVALAVPGSISKHRRAILEAYGVELFFTDPLEGSDGAIREVRLMMKAEPRRYWYADQYSNPMTWRAHYETTGPEIFAQTSGQITHFVAGLGTSGTFVGAGRRLRELKPDVRLVSMEPDGPMHGLEGLKHMETSIIPAIYDDAVADSRMEIATEEARAAALALGRRGGILLGPSGGANLAAALRLGRDLASQGRAAVIATIFCDSGERYLGERFWSDEPAS